MRRDRFVGTPSAASARRFATTMSMKRAIGAAVLCRIEERMASESAFSCSISWSHEREIRSLLRSASVPIKTIARSIPTS